MVEFQNHTKNFCNYWFFVLEVFKSHTNYWRYFIRNFYSKMHTSNTSSNSTRLFLMPKKYFSALTCKAKSLNFDGMTQWYGSNKQKKKIERIKEKVFMDIRKAITCFTIAEPSIGISSSFVIFEISLTAHSVSKLNFWNISSCRLLHIKYKN